MPKINRGRRKKEGRKDRKHYQPLLIKGSSILQSRIESTSSLSKLIVSRLVHVPSSVEGAFVSLSCAVRLNFVLCNQELWL